MEDYIDKLIAKNLANETSDSEDKQLKKLILENKEVEEKYNESKVVWQKSNIKQRKYDLNRGKHLINQKIEQAKNIRIIRIRKAFHYAAIFIGIVLVSYLVNQDLNRTKTVIAAADKIKQFNLPDNSVVYLNKNAQITYSTSKIKGFDRKVKLKGEAFFEVTKKGHKEFIVDAGNLNVQVLGTKFNVKQNSKQTTVTLNEGRVKLINLDKKDQKHIVMDPGGFVSFNSALGTIEQKIVNADVYNIWIKKRIVFDNFSVDDLSDIFRIHYQKTLIIKDKDFDCKVKGSAPTDDLNLLLKAFSEVLEKEINIKNDSIIIK